EVPSLPADSPSRRSEELFRDAFPDQYAGSNILLVLVRQGAELQDQDKKFIEHVLTPRLKQVTAAAGGGEAIVARIRTPPDQPAELLLPTQHPQPTLPVIELTPS